MKRSKDSLFFNKLNFETAKIPWYELQRFFAQGKVLCINHNEDLVSIAELIANDNSQQIQQLVDGGKILPVNDEQAREWINNDQAVWAVVVAPWILVQTPD